MDISNSPRLEKMQWLTPNKNEMLCNSISMQSPIVHKTPIKQIGMTLRQKAHRNNSGCFSVLPSHITPPSGLTKFVARNPFEADLTNRLHLSVISPTVFSKVASSPQASPVFSWNIDELAVIQPAKIDEFPVQQSHCTDPEIERKAQAAIDKFFKENQIIPSPWDSKERDNSRKNEMQTPLRGFDNTTSSSRESQIFKKDSWAQTTLSLPPNLPSHVEEVLKPYFTFTQEQNLENDEANSSGNSSLRRKLFAHEDSHDYETRSSLSITPINSSHLNSCSPLQSGMLIHGTPLRGNSGNLLRNHGTPLASEYGSPLNVSPIGGNIDDEMSCQSLKSRGRSIARLDFTADMSIEVSNGEVERQEEIRKTSIDNNWIELKPSMELKNSHQEEHNKTVDIIMQFEQSNYNKFEKKGNINPNLDLTSLKRAKVTTSDWCKIFSNESCAYQQNCTTSVTNGQQSIFQSAQDTGYQTCSINNTGNNIENCTMSVIKEKVEWDEHLLSYDDDIHLSDWKKDMKYMCSSTPSKFLKEFISDNK